MARVLKPNVAIRCDFCHKQIPKDKTAYQVKDGKAQGIFHGRRCFEGAYKHYEELEKTQA